MYKFIVHISKPINSSTFPTIGQEKISSPRERSNVINLPKYHNY
ncbi:hypothetical protein A1OE_1011 [Candidatus Endolissoclinum faulkneri L2]|uniref:Uncharacterized protein n=1 Tax=Candidatus Endolissoclinum faulkneri L2 TaxID=1193729 RepID=K7YHW8_9PROT|nr:hypothetical protein A1OE_1011 [Candidatus Endolissoclinum faulkneri L2]